MADQGRIEHARELAIAARALLPIRNTCAHFTDYTRGFRAHIATAAQDHAAYGPWLQTIDFVLGARAFLRQRLLGLLATWPGAPQRGRLELLARAARDAATAAGITEMPTADAAWNSHVRYMFQQNPDFRVAVARPAAATIEQLCLVGRANEQVVQTVITALRAIGVGPPGGGTWTVWSKEAAYVSR